MEILYLRQQKKKDKGNKNTIILVITKQKNTNTFKDV